MAGVPSPRRNPSIPLAMADVRARWRDLVERRLPSAACENERSWPIRFDHCFARVLLDNACGRPWREVIKPPAWLNAEESVLGNAIVLGEAVLADRADIHALNERSLEMRGKRAFRQRTPAARISPQKSSRVAVRPIERSSVDRALVAYPSVEDRLDRIGPRLLGRDRVLCSNKIQKPTPVVEQRPYA